MEHMIQLVCTNDSCPRRNYVGTREATVCPCCWSNLLPRYKADQIKKHRLLHLMGGTNDTAR
jgi:hypothetical protein